MSTAEGSSRMGGTARHEDAVDGSVFEGKFIECECRGAPIPHDM